LRLLPELIRTKVELIKLAVFIGRFAVGQWEPWDSVDLPPAGVLDRFLTSTIPEIVERTKSDLAEMLTFRTTEASPRMAVLPEPVRVSRELSYENLSQVPFDFMPGILRSMGIQVTPFSEGTGNCEETVLVNCVEASLPRVVAWGRSIPASRTLLVSDDRLEKECTALGKVLRLPSSYGCLQSACSELSRPVCAMRLTSGPC
jgi:hypothetical protein